MARICSFSKVNGICYNHKLDAPIISRQQKLKQILSGKFAVTLISTTFCARKLYLEYKLKSNETKTNPTNQKLLETLNMNQFSIS